MSGDKVISMAHAGCDGRLQSPEQALQDALGEIRENSSLKDVKKLLVLALDDNDGEYIVSFFQAGMKMSECLTLCDVAKTQFLAEMNYLPRVEDI